MLAGIAPHRSTGIAVLGSEYQSCLVHWYLILANAQAPELEIRRGHVWSTLVFMTDQGTFTVNALQAP